MSSMQRAKPGLLILLATIALAVACSDLQSPTLKDDIPAGPDNNAGEPQRTGGVFSDRAVALDPIKFPLVSSAADLAVGRYRYDLGDTDSVAIVRDDFVVGVIGDAPYVRRVLSTETGDGVLSVETALAHMSDIVNAGTFGITMPLDPIAGPATTFAGAIAVATTVGLDTARALEHEFKRTDVCQLLQDALDALPGNHPPKICGEPQSLEVGAGVTVSIEGTLDSLLILGGDILIDGTMDVGLTVESGGIEPGTGRPPVFFPCHLGAYLGCVATPTGGALIAFLRQYAPGITAPDSSLSPVRVCIPGTRVRIKKGFWKRVGLKVSWEPAVYRTCRVDDIGALPNFELPSVDSAKVEIRPHLVGEMTFRVVGDGALGLKIAIPSVAYSVVYKLSETFQAEVRAGLFIGLDLSMKNAGVTVKVTFDEDGVVTETWNETGGGWTHDFELTDSKRSAQILDLDNPDSLIVRVSAIAEVTAGLCVALVSCGSDEEELVGEQSTIPAKVLDKFKIEVKAKVVDAVFVEGTWSRDQVHPTDPLIDNWHISLDGGQDLTLGLGLEIDVGFKDPVVDKGATFGPLPGFGVRLAEYWGRGKILVETSTAGATTDADGFLVTIERADTLPLVIDSEAVRIPGSLDRGRPLDMRIDPSGTALFKPTIGIAPCTVLYSDALFFFAPNLGQFVRGAIGAARALGVNVPAFGFAAFCNLLIAEHTVTLSEVSDNCVVTGGPTQNVWLQQKNKNAGILHDTTLVHFDIVCDGTQPTGAVDITTSAFTSEPADYQVFVDGGSEGYMGYAETRVFTGLSQGQHTFTFTGGPRNCAPLDPVLVTVVANDTVAPPIPRICALPVEGPGTVTLSATTTGTATDADGYQVYLDGVQSGVATDTANARIMGVLALTPSVLHIGSIAPHCRATTFNPLEFMLDGAAAPIVVPFTAECTAATVDTVDGTIEAAKFPTPTVAIRLTTGELVSVHGPAAADVAQLAGSPVRLWGVLSPTSIDVYGFDLKSSAADPRWIGIVVSRAGKWWLFGEEALELVNPSPSLQTLTGAVVWVGGTRFGDAVTPFIFGVIREDLP